MIPFFRRIRKQLANDNKPLKYMRYAIGEIVLVVIGILIALSINNWNEKRKEKNEELLVLKSMKVALDKNLMEHYSDRTNVQKALKGSLKILKIIETNDFQNDSIVDYFSAIDLYTPFFPDQSAYQSLLSNGTELISNEEIRNKITAYFEGVQGRVTYFQSNPTRNPTLLLNDYIIKNFKVIINKDIDSMLKIDLNTFDTSSILYGYFDKNENILRIPKDINATLNDPEFKILLAKAVQGAASLNSIHMRGIEFIESLLVQIDNEIQKLNN
jgi:hypothetical protein